MFRSAIVATLAALTVFTVRPAFGDLQKDLRHTYTGKILSLRIPSNLDVLHFDANGQPSRPSEGEPWTTCGLLRVEKIGVSFSQILIEGSREAVILSQDSQKKLLLVELDRTVHITVDMPGSVHTLRELNPLLGRIFLPGDLIARMSAEWKSEVDLNRDLAEISSDVPDGRIGVLAQDRPVYVVNALPTPPTAIYKPIPIFPEKSRMKKIAGTFRVRMVVNEKGFPEVLEVLQHLREGLDNRVLAAVSQWRFKPGFRASSPVASMLIVDVKVRSE